MFVYTYNATATTTGTCIIESLDGEVPYDMLPYELTAKERDSESGLDMFGARYYGSSLGRFMTPDWAAKPSALRMRVSGILRDPEISCVGFNRKFRTCGIYVAIVNNDIRESSPILLLHDLEQ